MKTVLEAQWPTELQRQDIRTKHIEWLWEQADLYGVPITAITSALYDPPARVQGYDPHAVNQEAYEDHQKSCCARVVVYPPSRGWPCACHCHKR